MGEEVYYEGGPHVGDLIINVLIGLTLIGLPLTVGAIVRALWLRYRITNRRITVTGGWMGVIAPTLSTRNCPLKFLRYWLLGRYGVNVQRWQSPGNGQFLSDIYNYNNEK